MELPSDGWVKVLRGRRPLSEQWPLAKKIPTKMEPENHRGRRRHKPQGTQDKVKSLEAALSVLGPEENAAKEQIQEALRRAKEVSQPVRPNPDTIQAEAVAKVARLQRALDALDDLGPEVDATKKALKKASRGRTENDPLEILSKSSRISSSAPPDESPS